MVNVKWKKWYVKLYGIFNVLKQLVCLILYENCSFFTTSFTIGFRKDTVDHMKFFSEESLAVSFSKS